MKHILLFITTVVLACCYISCSEEKIEMYNQEPRINFNQRIVYGELTDTDYVKIKTDPYRVDSFRVRIQGDLLTSSRNLCVKQIDNSEYQNSLELLVDDKYTFSKLDGVEQKFYFKVKRPAYKTGNKTYGCNLVFDNGNPNHQFLKGIVSDSYAEVNYVWKIEMPDNWYTYSWTGWRDFSVAKYCYIMDVLGYTFDKITTYQENDEAMEKVGAAYEEYKREHGPILDENGNDIFPDE